MSRDAIVVGAGPNGLVAAALLADAGVEVAIYEAADSPGGGARTEALTLPGFMHDTYSAVYPLAMRSPVFEQLDLESHGLQWVQPEIPMVHPQLNGPPAVLARSIDETSSALGRDGALYRKLVEPFTGKWSQLSRDALSPMLGHVPRHPLLLARFGVPGMLPAALMAHWFKEDRTRAMMAGLAAHAIAPLTQPFTFGVSYLFLVAAHEVGWPIPVGGAQAITNSLVSYLEKRGVQIHTNHPVTSLEELPKARAYVFDLTPEHVARISGSRLPQKTSARFARYRRGPAVYKLDYALDAPVPWTSEECRRAGTVHIGSSYGEIAGALREVNDGILPPRPFLIAAQPTIDDPTRAPDGKHVSWLYAHVPNGYDGDATELIEDQLERFAPGFRSIVAKRSVIGPHDLQARNANNVGGDIAGGSFTGFQTVTRPVPSLAPYATANESIFICSSSTPPGPGVHGMCGYFAANTVLSRRFGKGT